MQIRGGRCPSEAKRAPPGRQHRSWSQRRAAERGHPFLDKVDEILYDGPYALSNSDIATMFMYESELSGNRL